MPNWLTNWLERHQHPVSRLLHAVAVPLLPFAVMLAVWQLAAWRWDLWYRPVLLVVVSYVLQWVGHQVEGNDMGEVILIKRRLGKPYVAVSPRYGRGDRSGNREGGKAGGDGGSGEAGNGDR